MNSSRRLLLLALDGLDGPLLHPAIDADLLPAFASLVARGAVGELAAGGVAEPAVAWTTLATGQRPETHRILDANIFDPVSGDLRPIGGESRRSHALWNIAHREGRASLVVGWPASHPADPIRGAFVSDCFFEVSARLGEPWAVPERSLHPAGLAAELADLRLHPDELGAAEIAPFVPLLAEVDQDRDRRLAVVMAALAETVSRHAVATHLLERTPWSFAAIRYPLIDRLARWFLDHHRHRAEGIDDRDARLYGGVVDSALRLLDGMLACLVGHAGSADLVVCSPMGWRCGPSPAAAESGERPSPPIATRSERGIVLLAGERIAADRLVHGASAIDLVPTALALLGLPIGEDLPGRVMREAFARPPEISSLTSWESLDGDFGRVAPSEAPAAGAEANELVRQLVDLGYLDRSALSERSERDQRLRQEHHLALSHLESLEWAKAVAPLERIVAARPIDGGCILLLASCQLMAGDLARCRSLAEQALRLEGSVGHARLLLAALAMIDRRPEEALAELARAEATGERGLAEKLAFGHLQLRRITEAERLVAVAFEENPESPSAWLLRAILHLERREDRQAAEAALLATGRRFHWPEAHAVLGVALGRIGHLPEAVAALERSISQRPTGLAHRALATILEQAGWDLEMVRTHRAAAEALARSASGAMAGPTPGPTP